MNKFALPIMLISLLYPALLQADELDDLLFGFEEGQRESAVNDLELLEDGFGEESTISTSEEQSEPILPYWLEFQGSFRMQSVYNFNHDRPEPGQPDYRGFSMLRTRGELIADVLLGDWQARAGIKGFYDFAYGWNNERNLYTNALLNDYEKDVELTELYIQGSVTNKLDLKIGRQIIVWGKSDNIRITDILNPLDLRQPGMADIRDIRLPVTMTKVDYYIGDWGLSGIVIHEPEFNKTPVYNSDFFPGKQATPHEKKYSWSLENQQFAFALNGIFSGWDFSYYLAYVFEQAGYCDQNSNDIELTREMSLMTGVAANIALGNFLLKGEIAYWEGLNYSTLPDEEKGRIDSMIGLEYFGINEATISFEFANYHILDFDSKLEDAPSNFEQDQYQYAFRYVHDFMHNTLHLTLLVSLYDLDFDGGGFERAQLEYDIDDAISVTGGIVLYQSGDYQMFNDAGKNDRLFFELEYRF